MAPDWRQVANKLLDELELLVYVIKQRDSMALMVQTLHVEGVIAQYRSDEEDDAGGFDDLTPEQQDRISQRT